MTRWIPCSERLPPESRSGHWEAWFYPFLVYRKGQARPEECFGTRDDAGVWTDLSGQADGSYAEYTDQEVLYWFELPPIPEVPSW